MHSYNQRIGTYSGNDNNKNFVQINWIMENDITDEYKQYCLSTMILILTAKLRQGSIELFKNDSWVFLTKITANRS